MIRVTVERYICSKEDCIEYGFEFKKGGEHAFDVVLGVTSETGVIEGQLNKMQADMNSIAQVLSDRLDLSEDIADEFDAIQD